MSTEIEGPFELVCFDCGSPLDAYIEPIEDPEAQGTWVKVYPCKNGCEMGEYDGDW
jgi:hypothetical protein